MAATRKPTGIGGASSFNIGVSRASGDCAIVGLQLSAWQHALLVPPPCAPDADREVDQVLAACFPETRQNASVLTFQRTSGECQFNDCARVSLDVVTLAGVAQWQSNGVPC